MLTKLLVHWHRNGPWYGMHVVDSNAGQAVLVPALTPSNQSMSQVTVIGQDPTMYSYTDL